MNFIKKSRGKSTHLSFFVNNTIRSNTIQLSKYLIHFMQILNFKLLLLFILGDFYELIHICF